MWPNKNSFFFGRGIIHMADGTSTPPEAELKPANSRTFGMRPPGMGEEWDRRWDLAFGKKNKQPELTKNQSDFVQQFGEGKKVVSNGSYKDNVAAQLRPEAIKNKLKKELESDNVKAATARLEEIGKERERNILSGLSNPAEQAPVPAADIASESSSEVKTEPAPIEAPAPSPTMPLQPPSEGSKAEIDEELKVKEAEEAQLERVTPPTPDEIATMRPSPVENPPAPAATTSSSPESGTSTAEIVEEIDLSGIELITKDELHPTKGPLDTTGKTPVQIQEEARGMTYEELMQKPVDQMGYDELRVLSEKLSEKFTDESRQNIMNRVENAIYKPNQAPFEYIKLRFEKLKGAYDQLRAKPDITRGPLDTTGKTPVQIQEEAKTMTYEELMQKPVDQMGYDELKILTEKLSLKFNPKIRMEIWNQVENEIYKPGQAPYEYMKLRFDKLKSAYDQLHAKAPVQNTVEKIAPTQETFDGVERELAEKLKGVPPEDVNKITRQFYTDKLGYTVESGGILLQTDVVKDAQGKKIKRIDDFYWSRIPGLTNEFLKEELRQKMAAGTQAETQPAVAPPPEERAPEVTGENKATETLVATSPITTEQPKPASEKKSFWKRLFGRKPKPVPPPAPTAEPAYSTHGTEEIAKSAELEDLEAQQAVINSPEVTSSATPTSETSPAVNTQIASQTLEIAKKAYDKAMFNSGKTKDEFDATDEGKKLLSDIDAFNTKTVASGSSNDQAVESPVGSSRQTETFSSSSFSSEPDGSTSAITETSKTTESSGDEKINSELEKRREAIIEKIHNAGFIDPQEIAYGEKFPFLWTTRLVGDTGVHYSDETVKALEEFKDTVDVSKLPEEEKLKKYEELDTLIKKDLEKEIGGDIDSDVSSREPVLTSV